MTSRKHIKNWSFFVQTKQTDPSKSKMKFVMIPTLLVLVSVLTGCVDWKGDGRFQISELPEAVSEPCPHPLTLVSRGGTVADDEVTVGRLGDALIECGREKEVAVSGFNKLKQVLTEE
jgi:predicted metal-binding membrane protein